MYIDKIEVAAGAISAATMRLRPEEASLEIDRELVLRIQVGNTTFTSVSIFAFLSREPSYDDKFMAVLRSAATTLAILCLCSCQKSETQRTIGPFLEIEMGMSRSQVAEIVQFEPYGAGGSGIARDYYRLSDGTTVSVLWTQGVFAVRHDGVSINER